LKGRSLNKRFGIEKKIQLINKIVKVMTTVYGVTKYGASEQIKRQLLDKDVPKKEVNFGEFK
jgi:DNA-directed RNA polymerase